MDRPDSISKQPHLSGVIDALKARLQAIDTGQLLFHLVDLVPAEALYFLAAQFNVLGTKGWQLASTEAQRRALVKQAVELNRYAGTPFAIRSALQRLSFTEIEIFEGAGLNQNGTYSGTWTYSGTLLHGYSWHWAEFAVRIRVNGDTPDIEAGMSDLLRAIIETWKPVRCTLINLVFDLAPEAERARVLETLTYTVI